MPSLHKDPKGRSPFFYCAYSLPNGKRKFRSTKKTKENEAWKVCNGWADAAKEAGADHRDREILDQMREARGRKPLKVPTIRKFFEDWLDGQKLHLSPNTHKRYSSSIRKLVLFLGNDADHDLPMLSGEQIEAFIRHEQEAGLAPKTLNLDLKAIHAALGKAFKRGHVKVNVAGTVDTKPNNSAIRNPFTRAQVDQLLTAADDEWYGFIFIGYFTGLRLGDIASLKWENIDLTSKVMTVNPQKRPGRALRPPLQIPMHKSLHIWFRLRKAEGGVKQESDFIFMNHAKLEVTGNTGLSNTFTRLIEKAGIKNYPVKEKKAGSTRGRDVYAYSFHSLRATFNTELEAAGVSAEVRMKLSDHTSRDVNMLYTKPEASRLADEISKLPFPDKSKKKN